MKRKLYTQIDSDALALTYKNIFESFLLKGFTSKQSFKLLMVIVKKSFKKT